MMAEGQGFPADFRGQAPSPTPGLQVSDESNLSTVPLQAPDPDDCVRHRQVWRCASRFEDPEPEPEVSPVADGCFDELVRPAARPPCALEAVGDGRIGVDIGVESSRVARVESPAYEAVGHQARLVIEKKRECRHAIHHTAAPESVDVELDGRDGRKYTA
jgi:hypothetical protein